VSSPGWLRKASSQLCLSVPEGARAQSRLLLRSCSDSELPLPLQSGRFCDTGTQSLSRMSAVCMHVVPAVPKVSH